MKVVLCRGGQGQRIRDQAENVPKPMVQIGYRPMLWHIMRYYAHFGHKDFILCLGYRGDVIKDYFLNYKQTVAADCVTVSKFGSKVEIHLDSSFEVMCPPGGRGGPAILYGSFNARFP